MLISTPYAFVAPAANFLFSKQGDGGLPGPRGPAGPPGEAGRNVGHIWELYQKNGFKGASFQSVCFNAVCIVGYQR